MSIDALIKNSREYMDSTGPVRLEFDYSQPPSVPEVRELPILEYHRYGPEDRPDPKPPDIPKVKKNPEENEPLAYCLDCKANRPMKWKSVEKRGKHAESWFVCAKCNSDRLELRMIMANTKKSENNRK